jgi:hypothetical protein
MQTIHRTSSTVQIIQHNQHISTTTKSVSAPNSFYWLGVLLYVGINVCCSVLICKNLDNNDFWHDNTSMVVLISVALNIVTFHGLYQIILHGEPIFKLLPLDMQRGDVSIWHRWWSIFMFAVPLGRITAQVYTLSYDPNKVYIRNAGAIHYMLFTTILADWLELSRRRNIAVMDILHHCVLTCIAILYIRVLSPDCCVVVFYWSVILSNGPWVVFALDHMVTQKDSLVTQHYFSWLTHPSLNRCNMKLFYRVGFIWYVVLLRVLSGTLLGLYTYLFWVYIALTWRVLIITLYCLFIVLDYPTMRILYVRSLWTRSSCSADAAAHGVRYFNDNESDIPIVFVEL